MDFTFQMIQAAIDRRSPLILFENPEDLGALQHGPYEGQRPASMWQSKQFEALLQTGQIDTVAFYQQDFGAEYLRPTRLMLRGFTMHEKFRTGKPQFDEQGFYQGSSQKRSASQQLIGQSNSQFNTMGSEQWPSEFCRWVAQQILNSFTSTAFGGGNFEQDVKSKPMSYKISEPEGPNVLGGVGNPRLCRVPGKTKEFHDGAGLASPGGWDVERRCWCRENWVTELRKDIFDIIVECCGGLAKLDKAFFGMAVKGEHGCSLVQDESLKRRLVDAMLRSLEKESWDVKDLRHIAEGQPFRPRLMQALLQHLRDSDHKFLLDGELGFSVGVVHPLPRTPHMYEEQTSWKLEEDPYMKDEVWRENYDTVGEHEAFVREHFAAECEEGLMDKLSIDEARRIYGDKIAISSLSVLVEETHGNKKRIIHNATHGTKINNRIKCRDKQRSPGAREKLYLLDRYKKKEQVVLRLVGDISKAHRRFLHHPSERGLLACRISPKDDFIFINKVGTFGVVPTGGEE